MSPQTDPERAPEAALVLFGALLLDHAPPWYAILLPTELQRLLRPAFERRAAFAVRCGETELVAGAVLAWFEAGEADLDAAIGELQAAESAAGAHVAAAMLEARLERCLDRAGARRGDRDWIWGAAMNQTKDSRLTDPEWRCRAAAAGLEAFARCARERIGV